MTTARVFPRIETRRYLPLTRVYSSIQLQFVAGITLRQLQWWDEHRVVQANHNGWRREYTPAAALLAMVIADLRSKRLTLQKIRPLLPILRRQITHALTEPSEQLPYLLVGPRSAQLFSDAAKAMGFLDASRVPVYVVNLPEKRRRMEMLEEA